MNYKLKKYLITPLAYLKVCALLAQAEHKEMVSFGDMDKWQVREVKESFVLGSNTKYVYELSQGDTIFNNGKYQSYSPWAVSSVMAKVKGVVKASVTVFPEERDQGYCARLETRVEEAKVLGLINIRVLASGTIFLGQMVEPITGTSNPQSKLITGIPFTKRPKALEYDYKLITGGKCIKATGFSSQSKLDYPDMAETHILLQHRWEDSEGKIYAKRLATGWERFIQSEEKWQNGHRLELHYGNITEKGFYQDYMQLINGDRAYYTRNSKGKMVPIEEIGWANEDEEVTHLILQMSSSNGGAYIGCPDSKFWIDNVKLVY